MIEEKLTRRERVWNWTKENADVIVVYGLTAVAVGASVYLGHKVAQAQEAQYQELMDEFNKGNRILPTRDGGYLVFSPKTVEN